MATKLRIVIKDGKFLWNFVSVELGAFEHLKAIKKPPLTLLQEMA
jgi:hypothetical protein